MVIKGRDFIVAAGMWAALLGACAPALAQHGGGGHAGGGAHMGGGAHFGGAPHAAAGHFGGAAAVHYAGGGAHFAGAQGGVGHGYAGGTAGLRGNAYGGRGGYAYPGGAYRHGYSTGAYWGGGYWRGGYWPRAYYGYGYAWFLPVLPLAYATYWYGGVPYYYASDVYYTWNPAYDGYTATDPPPAADTGVSGSDGSYDASPPAPAADPNAGGQQAQIFMYPKNGQSEAQQSTDKRECEQWAAAQAGQGAGTGDDYRRAMLACVAGRGYSAN